MDFGLHFEVQNHKKSIKKRCRNLTRIWRRKILRKKSFATGWRRGRWSLERRIRRFRRGFGENPTCKNFKHAGTCLRQGAADLKAQAPLPPAPKKKHGDRILEQKGVQIVPSGALFLVSWRVSGPLERHLGGIGDSRVILGGSLARFWEPLGTSWAPFGDLGVPFWRLGGCFWADV